MKLPSLFAIGNKALETFKRFPIIMLVSFIGTIAFIYLLENDSIKYGSEIYFSWQKFIFVCGLAIPFLFAISFYHSRKKLKILNQIVLYVVLFLLLILFYFTFVDLHSHYFRYLLYLASAFLLVSFSGFIGIKNEVGFWEFNKQLLFRLLNSLFFSLALQLGLSIAIASIGELFKVHWSNTIYLDIFGIIIGIFNTWYFLSGININFDDFDDNYEYPKLLKLFTQYILIPLSIVYLIILYAYSLKIIIQWQLPIGWTSSLIIAYSAIGILAYLLLYPLRNDVNNKWSQTFSKLFFICLFPIIILMALAVNQRIGDYGITEPRYFLIVITIWLLGAAIYYTFSKAKNIKLVPISLFIIAIFVSYGPWSAFNISENSQINRIVKFLDKKKIIENSKIVHNVKLNKIDYDNLVSTLQYLEKKHNLNNLISELESITNNSLNLPKDSSDYSKILKAISISSDIINDKAQSYIFNIFDHHFESLDIGEFQHYYKINYNDFDQMNHYNSYFLSEKDMISIGCEKSEIKITYSELDDSIIKFNTNEILLNLAKQEKDKLIASDFQIVAENNYMKILLNINNISGFTENNGELKINELNCDVFIKLK